MIPEKFIRFIKNNNVIMFSLRPFLFLKNISVKMIKRLYLHHNGVFVLKLIDNAISGCNENYFLDFGTLLGVIRENNFLKHDLDVDIGVFSDDNKNIENIKKELEKRGASLIYEFWYNNKIVEYSFSYMRVKFDIHFYTKMDNKICCYLMYTDVKSTIDLNRMNVILLKYNNFEKTKKINFKGQEVYIPLGFRELLEEKYGINWKRPDKNWKYWLAPNVEACPGYGKLIKCKKLK